MNALLLPVAFGAGIAIALREAFPKLEVLVDALYLDACSRSDWTKPSRFPNTRNKSCLKLS